ncbi:MAG: NFACT family protein [Acidobacteriota bacterium]
MEDFLISGLVKEITPILIGQTLHRGFLVDTNLYLDFRLKNGQVLHIRLDPNDSSIFLDTLPKNQSNEAHPFLANIRKEILGWQLINIHKPNFERVVILEFQPKRPDAHPALTRLILSFAGRNTNAYLTDKENVIYALFKPRGNFNLDDRFSFTQFDKNLEELNKLVEARRESLDEPFIETTLKLFGPLLKKEFNYRKNQSGSREALLTLLKDLTLPPTPLIYTPVQLAQITRNEISIHQLIGIKKAIQLSSFPLHSLENSSVEQTAFPDLSTAARTYFQLLDKAIRAQNEFKRIEKLLSDESKKLQGYLKNLTVDQNKFEDPDKFKRLGDLLLANLSTARIIDNQALVIDYFDEHQPEISIALGEGKSPQQAAQNYFQLFQKARRAQDAIAKRLLEITSRLQTLSQLLSQLQGELNSIQFSHLLTQAEKALGIKPKYESRNTKEKSAQKARPLGRRFLSTSGHEIIVGKNNKENDAITFRIARSTDIWLHAADYPGSHVVIRGENRQEVPVKTIQEAAELAAFFSQAKELPKVAVHYTQKKFVSKPPRAQPGLVRLSSFKTILVEPRCVLQKS